MESDGTGGLNYKVTSMLIFKSRLDFVSLNICWCPDSYLKALIKDFNYHENNKKYH